MTLPFLIFLLGLLGLWLGADVVIKSALGIAHKFKFSETFVGITILSIGTTLAEITVSMTGAVEKLAGNDTSALVIGNIVGSNISNMGLILGLAGLITLIVVEKQKVFIYGSAMVAALLAFFLFAQDGLISRVDGLFLLSGYIIYLVVLVGNERKTSVLAKLSRKYRRSKIHQRKITGVSLLLGKLFMGLLLVVLASNFVLKEGLQIAEILQISPALVGIILVGIGTSLPEIVVAIRAVMSGSSGLSVGNLIGSNINNNLLALGLSATVSEWNVSRGIVNFDLPFLIIMSVVIIMFILTRNQLQRRESILVLALYYGYIMLKLQGF